MNIVKGYPTCRGCKHSGLLYCNKFNEICPGVSLGKERHQLTCVSCLDQDSYEAGAPAKKEKIEKNIGYFHIPGPENLQFFKSLMMLKDRYPEIFYENRDISEIYGSFPGAIWNGRTPNYGGEAMTTQHIEWIRDEIEKIGLSLNLTWNNHLVAGTDVYDRFCNSITQIFHNGKHSITVASPDLYKYLKEKYPNYKYYQSVISTETDAEFVKKDEGFDMFLFNRKLNNNWEELKKIPVEERGKFEFLCNDACTPICNRIGHYNVVNKCLLNRSDESCLGDYCTIDHDFMLYNMRLWPMTIKPEDIDEYIDNGFVHFKLCSRGDIPPVLIYKTLPYLIKPEFLADAFQWIMVNQMETEEEFKFANSNNKQCNCSISK